MTDGQVQISEKDKEQLMQTAKKDAEAAKPKKNTGAMVVRAILIAIVVVYFILLFFGKFFLPADSVILNSINIFSKEPPANHMLRMLSYIILTLAVAGILRFYINRMTKNEAITKRTGIAVIELLGNLVKYASILIVIFLILSAIGVDTSSILAGLGILSLIIGLGVTSLVEDVVAGIFIIAEHLFDIGDTIVLDGFRGKVIEIGIRSTKLADVGDDVLVVRNSSIGSFVNLTYRQSNAAVTVPLAPSENLERVDEIVRNSDFDKIGAKYPSIKSGPLYLSMCGMDSKGVQNLLLVAGCKEDDRYEVERILLKEFKNIMEENGIKLGATGIEEA